MRLAWGFSSKLTVIFLFRAFMHIPVTLPKELLRVAILEYPVKWEQHQFYLIFKRNYSIKSIKVLLVHLATYCSCSLKDILSKIHFSKMRCASITDSAKSSFRFSYDILQKNSNKFFGQCKPLVGVYISKIPIVNPSEQSNMQCGVKVTEDPLWLCQASTVWLGEGQSL